MKKQKKQVKRVNKTNESGRSMVEMVGVLAVMGLITAGAFVLIQSGLSSQKISRTADELDILVSNGRSMTAQSDDFSSLPSDTKEGATLAQSILKSSGKSPLGGDYFVMQKGGNLVVGISKLSTEDCTTMGSRAYSGGRANCDTETNTFSVSYTKNVD